MHPRSPSPEQSGRPPLGMPDLRRIRRSAPAAPVVPGRAENLFRGLAIRSRGRRRVAVDSHDGDDRAWGGPTGAHFRYSGADEIRSVAIATTAAKAAAASACIPGRTCWYTLIVNAALACPSRSLTTFTGTPAFRSKVA